MSKQSTPQERLSRAISAPSRGVLGLVDELLDAAREQDLELVWQAGGCQVNFLNVGPRRIEVPLQKSVARAILARIAALCNERNPDSVSPYGGQGQVVLAGDSATPIRVAFINTAEKQSLELSAVRLFAAPDAGTVSLKHSVGQSNESEPPTT